MILNDNKILCRPKFLTLFRIVRCLDCTYPDDPNKMSSIMHSDSPINNEILKKIWFLDDKGLSPEKIAIELQYVYGKHVISSIRD